MGCGKLNCADRRWWQFILVVSTSCLSRGDGSSDVGTVLCLEDANLKNKIEAVNDGESFAKSQRGICSQYEAHPPHHKQGVSRWYLLGQSVQTGTHASALRSAAQPVLKDSSGAQVSAWCPCTVEWTRAWDQHRSQ